MTAVAPDRRLASSLAPAPRPRRLDGLALLLVGLTFAAFLPALHLGFVNYDDPMHVTANAHVRGGLSFSSLLYAWTTLDAGYYMPLTWMSYMLDATGSSTPQAWRFHLGNIALHAITTVLLYLAFAKLSGSRWRSFLLAALFAVHPLRVEPVVWVTLRKDTLSAALGALSLLAFARFIRDRRRSNYLLMLGAFSASLLAKPSLLTLPLVLPLLERWSMSTSPPSPQTSSSRSFRWLLPYLPMLGVSAVVAALSFVGERQVGVVSGYRGSGDVSRAMGNALISCVRYLSKVIYPAQLSVFYPARHWEAWQVAAAGLTLVAITVCCLWLKGRRPALVVGWFWYLLILLPVSGILRIGAFSIADRYTYLPSIGLMMMVAWFLPDLSDARLPTTCSRLTLGGVLPSLAILALLLVTWRQIAYWHDSLTLFTHARDVCRPSPVVENNLGQALAADHRLDEAAREFRVALALDPTDGDAHYNLGVVRYQQHRPQEAETEFISALTLSRKPAPAHYNLAILLAEQGRSSEAIDHYRQAIRLAPDQPDYHINLAGLLIEDNRLTEAIAEGKTAVRLAPQDYQARVNVGLALARHGDLPEATEQYRAALSLRPTEVQPRHMLAMLLAQQGDLDAALVEVDKILRDHPGDPSARQTRARILAAMATH